MFTMPLFVSLVEYSLALMEIEDMYGTCYIQLLFDPMYPES